MDRHSETPVRVRQYQWTGTRNTLRSTGRNESGGLSTRDGAKRKLAIVIGNGPTGLDHGSLHPQRPSGRSPHRPLTFLAEHTVLAAVRQALLWVCEKKH